VPAGYGVALLGVGLFALGGLGDMAWHLAFGIEQNMDAALSPTHLLLGTSMALVVSGPLRAAWRRPAPPAGWLAYVPLLLSLTYTLSLLTLLTQYAHPFVNPLAAQDNFPGDPNQAQALGITSIALQAGLLSGLVLLAIRRWRLPWGSLTFVFTLNALLLSLTGDQYRFIPAALAAGLGADVLLHLLQPSVTRPVFLRLFAFAMPALLYLCYFLALDLTGGIWWTIHFWLGSVVVAGLVGLMLSFLLLPPTVPVPGEYGE
jgi:hypothetical protein